MDITAIGILIGIVAGAGWIVIRLLRHLKINIGTIFVVCLAGFSIPSGAKLISAALSGDMTALPLNWREYVAAAGVVIIGLSLQYLITRFRTSIVSKENESFAGDSNTNSVDSEKSD